MLAAACLLSCEVGGKGCDFDRAQIKSNARLLGAEGDRVEVNERDSEYGGIRAPCRDTKARMLGFRAHVLCEECVVREM